MANNTYEIQKLYIAYFNRPADPAGLEYWTSQLDAGVSMTQVQNSFSSSAEYQAFYVGKSNIELINALYLNLFGRDGEVDGLLWWANEITQGRQTIQSIAGALASGTTPGSADYIAINAKILAATAYTDSLQTFDELEAYSTPAAFEAAGNWLSTVVDEATLSAAIINLEETIDGNGTLGSTFTLTDIVTSQTTADITTTIDPVITKETYWGYNPDDGGVPLSDLVGVLTQYLNYQYSVLNLFNTVDTLNQITNITIAGADDDLQGGGGDAASVGGTTGGTATSSDAGDATTGNTTGGTATTGDINAEGDYTGNYEITLTLSDGSTTNAQIQLSQQQFDFINGLLFDAEGNTRLFEVETKTWPQVELKDQNGNVVLDAFGNPIRVNLYEYTAEGVTTKTYTPIVLTPSLNNGGTIEQGITTAGDDTIVAGRLELLHQAYIDGGAGRNTLEIDAKGYFAQPLALLNIQEVHVQNLPNIYTLPADPLGSAYDVQGNSSYPDLDPDTWASYTSSIIDLSRAASIDRLVLTEGNYEGLQVGHVEFPGSLTVNGIRNGAVVRFEGAFTQDVNLNYGEGLTGPLTVELLIGMITADLNFAHNTDALHLVSLGGSANSFGSEDIGGRLTNLKISGDAALYIRNDLDGSFQDETPITIDASENTGGVNLELSDSQNVTFIGSQGNDIFKVDTNEDEFFGGSNYGYNNSSVTIQGGAGDNLYVIGDTYLLNITDGNGNNDYEVDWAVVANIEAGDGNNHFQIDDVQSANLVAGNGNNKFEVYAWNDEDTAYPEDSLDVPVEVNITAGNGKNVIDAELNWGIGVANITVGNGGNDIDANGHEINIATGTGTDVIKVLADIIKINSGGGGDTVTIGGWDYDYVGTAELGGNGSVGSGSGDADWGNDGALVQINLGSGNSTVILGSAEDYQWEQDNAFPGTSSLTAHEGSFITGANVTLFVNTVADLRAATLTGVSSVVIDDDAFDIYDAPTANQAVGGVNAAVLTLTASQFLAIGADNFRVDGAVFNTHGFVKIIVEESTSLTALGVDDLPRNIDLLLEVQDGVTLTMTAEQLHTRVAQNGVTLVKDGNTDTVNGNVVITGGGLNFDPFNTSDTIQSVIDGQVYYGGSLSSDFQVDGSDKGTDVGPGDPWYNVQVKSVVNGYDRPADAAAEVVLTLDSTGAATLQQGAFESWHSNLEIIGDQDIVFTGAVGLGEVQGVPTNPFDIDFSSLEGNVINFTVDNFELLGQGGSITGNAGVYGDSAEVLISIAADDYVAGDGKDGKDKDKDKDGGTTSDGIGFDEPDAQSLVSSGVTRYVVTTIDGMTAAGSPGSTATIKLCDTAQDIEVFALRGNYNDTLVVQDAAWGLVFELQGGGTAKAEGPTGTSNVGALVANYEWEHADAVVNLVHSVAGDVRPLHAEGITINNADSITINGDGTSVTIHDVNGDDVTSLDVNNAGNVTIVDTLPGALTEIDAAGVTGTFSAVIAPDGDFSFVGAAGGSTLTFEIDSGFTADDGSMDATVTTIDGGTAGVVLVLGDDATIDLEEATLINVTQVVLGEEAELSLTMAQADEIGAANFVLALGNDEAVLNLSGLDGEPFALANYADGITVGLVTIADLPVVTLHPDTDLTGIGGLRVPEGTVLNLTAAQFQQLGGNFISGPAGWGTIAGIGGTTNFTVNITDLTQVDVDNDLNGDGVSSNAPGSPWEHLNLSQVTADTKTITLAESVTLQSEDDLGGFDVIMGDDMTLALADIQQADGLSISGGSNTTLQFNDTFAGAFESIDASGFSVDTLKILNVLVANRNVDLMFLGLQESVTKEIYNGLGWVDGVTQNVVLVEGTTVEGFVVFNKPEADVEIRDFVLTMEGGTEITGNLRLSASDNEDDLQQMDLQTVTINSNATADDALTTDVVEGTNRYTGKTANIIGGDITSKGTGYQGGTYTSVDNDLLNVTINAEQDFILEGDIIFESVVGNDDVTANDDEEATAILNVNGPADVTIEGALDIGDNDVDALEVNHVGTGTMDIRLDGAALDSADDITINGDAVGADIIRIASSVDLSDDTLVNIDQILLEDGSNLTLTFDQYQALGSIVDLAEAGDDATISIVGLGNGDVFDATLLPEGITVDTITLEPGTVTIAPGSDFTDVGEIIIPEGGTLNISAELYAQLLGAGTITVLDTDGNTGNDEATVNIIGLTQAIVDEDGFDITAIDEDIEVTVTLGEARVNLGTYDDNGNLTYTANLDSAGFPNPPDATFILADDQTLGVVNNSQADFLVVESLSPLATANTSLIWMFDSVPGGAFAVINASNYSVSTLKTLNVLVNGTNVESMISELPSEVTLQIYHNPEDLGMLNGTLRVVVVEEGVTVAGSVMFNDPDTDDEVLTLNLTLLGGVEIDGSVLLSTTDSKDSPPLYFQSLIINSEGTAENYLEALGGNPGVTANIITGDIDADWDGGPIPAVPPFPKEENNLLSVIINATQDLEIQGRIALDSVDAGGNAFLTVSNTSNADVTIGQIDILDEEVATLAVANNGTGNLTITGGSPAIIADAGESFDKLFFSGTGDIVIGDHDLTTPETGIDAHELSLIDASGMSGDLDLGEIVDIDSASFSFVAGSGVTKLTLTDDNLDSTGVDNIAGNSDDTSGWSFDFTAAAAGSEFHLTPDWIPADFVDGSILTIDMGQDAVLYIDATMDLSGLVLSIDSDQPIVLGDGVTLTLTAAQANGLNIVAGADTGVAGFTGVVNIVDLGDDPVDLSGIDAGIAGTATLEDDDVTLDVATLLGDFSITLKDLNPAGDSSTLAGQTIRFATEVQATRDVIVDDNGQPNLNDSSTNVVWLFDSITAVGGIDTSGYDGALGRLWFYADLLASEGGDVEQLFTTLPSTILRVEVEDLAELNVLLQSQQVDRVMEIVHFATVGDLTFSDMGISPEEHLSSLTLKLGGQTTVGNIVVNDVVADPANTDLTTIDFNSLTIVSHRAVRTGDLLASELYVNDNDATVEFQDESGVVPDTSLPHEPENALPNNINTVGNISVGAGNAGVDLVRVNIDTLGVTTTGDSSAGNGAAIQIGTITFGYTAGTALTNNATLDVTGANNITIASVIATDPDLGPTVTVDASGFTATLVAPGTSPAIQLGAQVETLVFTNTNAVAGTINLGSSTVANPNAGVIGAGLSAINASNFDGTLNLGILALIDGTNDDSTPLTPANDGLIKAFTLTSGAGVTTATLGKDPDSANVPTLAAGSEWVIDYTSAAAGSRLTLTDDVVFGAPALPGDPLPKLTLMNVDLYIQGDVDLTGVDLSGIDLNSDIFVAAGNSLTLTEAQAEALTAGVAVTGDGTVYIVSEVDTDAAVALDLSKIQTVNVDLSGLTNAGIVVPQANAVVVTLNPAGAVNDAAAAVGFNFVGSGLNDAVTGSNLADTITGGAGNDTVTGGAGNDTYNVDAGSDTIVGLATGDVLVVSAGATANAANIHFFVATAATVNNGTANLTTFGDGSSFSPDELDVSAVVVGNGFNLFGGQGVDSLIGSNFADVIEGGGVAQTAGDVLTGNGGADTFLFLSQTSVPETVTPAVTTQGEDWERVAVTAGPTNPGTITIPYSVNNGATTANVTVAVAGGETAAQLATAIRAAFVTAGFTAVLDGANNVEVRGAFGSTLQLGTFNDGTTLAAATISDATTNLDVAQVSTVTIGTLGGNNVVVGEAYTLSFALAGGSTTFEVKYTATTTSDNAVAAGLESLIDALGGLAVVASSAGNVLTITDNIDDNGGFTVTPSATGGFDGSTTSGNAADPATLDVITDFGIGGADKVDFKGLVAGSVANYAEEAVAAADYATALAAADLAFNGAKLYYLTSVTDIDGVTAGNQTSGVLFFDADADGTVDGAVLLTGVTSANFTHTDIIASV